MCSLRSPPSCQRDYDHKGPVTTVALHPNQVFSQSDYSFCCSNNSDPLCHFHQRVSSSPVIRMEALRYGISQPMPAHTSWCPKKGSPFGLSLWPQMARFWSPPTARLAPHSSGFSLASDCVNSHSPFTSSPQGNCYIWKMENGRDTTDLKPVLKLEAHESYVLKCLLSPDVRCVSQRTL